MSAIQYARLVSRKYRGSKLPKTNRKMRPRVLAWAGPAAFYPNRFYEIDKWYKARIEKPDLVPQLHVVDPTRHFRSLDEIRSAGSSEPVNIGFAKNQDRGISKTAADPQLEKLARTKRLLIDVENAGLDDWRVSAHAEVFTSLFRDNVYFDNTQKMQIMFGDAQVHTGNVLWAADTKDHPEVSIGSISSGGFNTLLAVNIDGNAFEGKDGEAVQWLVTNIPDGQSVSSGEEKVPWLQALPFHGTGYHRLAFVLFRHSQKVDVPTIVNTLESRIISIADFYKRCEDIITPSCLLFSNVAFDTSVKKTLHSLQLQSPMYELNWNPPLKRHQEEFPMKPMPFDLYFDQYRDEKESAADILQEKFSKFAIRDVQPPKVLDDNYVENKKSLDAWVHARLLHKNRKNSPLLTNHLSS